MSWLRAARAAVVQVLADKLDVPVLGYEPRGDFVGGTYVTVRLAAADPEEAELEVRAVSELRADRTDQDVLDELVDDIDTIMPAGVYLRAWQWTFDDDLGASVATGLFFTRRYSGWCDPTTH